MSEQQATPRPGTFCWMECVVGDTEAAKSFYTELFGWRTQASEMADGKSYTMFFAGEEGVGGLMQLPDPNLPPHWMAYVAVEDITASAQQAQDLGATLIHPPTEVPGHGTFAVIKDPAGAVFSLWQSVRAG